MKRTLLLAAAAFAAAFVFGHSSVKAQPVPSGSTEQIITQLEQDWGMASVKKDVATYDRIMAPEYMWSGPEGETADKAQNIDEVKSGVYTCTSFHLDEVKVKVYGDTAVVFGLETEKSTYKGKDSSGQYRFTDVFVKRNGVWQAVASHSSNVVKH
jgi:ketosteroid isomerase-like protein